MGSAAKLSLIVFSNPPDSDRLRLDAEHRGVDEALKNVGYPRDAVTRLHASRLDDFVTALREAKYDIIHFSGHGSPRGFFVETGTATSQLVGPNTLASVIGAVSGTVRVVLCMSCFSAESADAFAAAADYVVAASGPLGDDAAVTFVKTFYECYLDRRSVETAFFVARDLAASDDPELQVLLWKRRPRSEPPRALVTAFPKRDAPISVDVTEALSDIERLKLSTSDVLRELTQKLEVHRWIFSAPRQRVLLPLGRYIGMFSWDTADEVKCERLFKIASETSEELTQAFVGLTILYNDLFVAYYRTRSAFDPSLRLAVKKAIEEHRAASEHLFEQTHTSEQFRTVAPDEFKLARGIILEHVAAAERKFHREVFGEAASHLEAALSALHGLIEAVAEKISIH